MVDWYTDGTAFENFQPVPPLHSQIEQLENEEASRRAYERKLQEKVRERFLRLAYLRVCSFFFVFGSLFLTSLSSNGL